MLQSEETETSIILFEENGSKKALWLKMIGDARYYQSGLTKLSKADVSSAFEQNIPKAATPNADSINIK